MSPKFYQKPGGLAIYLRRTVRPNPGFHVDAWKQPDPRPNGDTIWAVGVVQYVEMAG